MENKRARRPQLRTLICPECGERGLLKTILWGMPEEGFNYDKFASGGCVIPSAMQPDCRCRGCHADWYRDEISGIKDGVLFRERDEF
jgi:hypothetical protein